jgi:hypothetical protein
LSEGGEAQTEVTVKVEESQFIKFVDEVHDQLT